MRYWIPALIALTTTATNAADESSRARKMPAMSLLPHGSELQGVVIPRHDKNRRLVSSLKADVITLVDDEIIAGTNVTIEFYDGDGSQKAQIDLKHATLNQLKGMLHTVEPVLINAKSFKARGSGLHYEFQNGQGFLTGPATTWIHTVPQTAMKPKASSIIGATGIALISQASAIAAPPNDASKQREPVMVKTVHESPVITARNEAQQQLKDDLKAADAADDKAKAFLDQTPINSTTLLNGEQASTHTSPLDIKPGPNDTVITCDGGIYFDADKGLLVYLKNVTVNDPRYTLSGADELKIFFSQDTKPAADDKGGKPAKTGIGSNFDKVERIVATGAVRILQRAVAEGKQAIEASGAVFTFHPETGDIILSGGYPWVLQGARYMRAKEANLTLRIKKTGSFVTEGQWEMGGPLNNP